MNLFNTLFICTTSVFLTISQIDASDYEKPETEINLDSITRVNSSITEMIIPKEKKNPSIDNISIKMNGQNINASIIAANICCYFDRKNLFIFSCLNKTTNKIAGFVQSSRKEDIVLEINEKHEKSKYFLAPQKKKRLSFTLLNNPRKEHPLERHVSLLQFIQSLTIHDYSLTKESSKIIAQYCPNLKKLDLSNKGEDIKKWNAIGDDGLKYLIKIDSLEDLNLSGNKISNTGAKLIPQFKKLKALTLSHNDIDDTGVDYLVNIRNLEELDLSYAKIQQKGAQMIATKMKNICKVNLDHNMISKGGTLALIGNTNITDLDLSSCSLVSPEIIEAMKNMPLSRKIKISPLNMKGKQDDNKFLNSL